MTIDERVTALCEQADRITDEHLRRYLVGMRARGATPAELAAIAGWQFEAEAECRPALLAWLRACVVEHESGT